MAPATQPVSAKTPPANPAAGRSDASVPSKAARTPGPPVGNDDGTNQLLKWGGWTFGAGLFFALLTKFLFGGIGPQGPHTNSGWMALIVTMMCLPFGFLLLLLGVLKWIRNLRTARQ